MKINNATIARSEARSEARTGRTLLSLAALAALAASALVAGCSGGGADVQENPITSVPPSADYKGPPPATADVQSFKINLWDNIRTNDRCGACHNEGGQVPTFARSDDVNLAYQDVGSIVTLSDPAGSRMVEKVEGGHNCWLASDAACGEILTTWITGWANDAGATGGTRQIDLKAPTIKDPGTSRTFPGDSGLFSATVYPVVTQYCAGCHASSAGTPQSPFFADADVDSAYDAVKSKLDLDDPASSRLVVRLRDEFHNCWDDCLSNANTMQSAVESFAGQITPTEVDPALVISKALSLIDGTVASGGNRFEAAAIATWEFKTGSGNTAFDTSGVDPAIDLTLSGEVEWVGGWGINVKSGKAQGSTTASKKLHDMIKTTGEYSIEAWVVPANVVQEEARIVSYSAGTMARNFTLAQNLYDYTFANRSSVTDGDGQPALQTNSADEDLQASLQHVVATFDPVEGRKIYVNGAFTDDVDDLGGASIADWDDTFAFVLGNEVSGDRQFAGVFRLVSIHNRVLSPEQIVQNFDAGVGEKFFLLFSVGHLINVPESYILFEVQQFDSYAYLFNKPHFISLDSSASYDGIPIAGIRIGINGAEAQVGQAYRNVDTQLSKGLAVELGQPLSPLGTVIGLQKGPDSDEFFLSFDVLGANTNVRTDDVPLAPPPAVAGDPVPEIGVKLFDEINATMSQVTGIGRNQTDVRTTYDTIRQQLPTVENVQSFLSSHQVAIAQLSIEYCNALIEDTGARSQLFPDFTFSDPVPTAYGTPAARDNLLDPLIAAVNNTNVARQPVPQDVKDELNVLIDQLTVCGGSCPAGRTETVAKAACAALLGSATMLLQ